MASVNKAILVGRLGRDPESRTFPSGDMVTNVTIATSERWKDKNTGEQKEETQWHNVRFGQKLAEIAAKYLRKGAEVYVEGAIKTRKYTDKNGVEKYSTEIHATSMQMLGGKPQGDSDSGYGGNSSQRQPARAPAPQRQAPAPQYQQAASGFDDLSDIPFIDPLRLSSPLHTAI